MALKAPEIRGYALEQLLGQGSLGGVWRGRQLSTGQPVAVKIIRDPPPGAQLALTRLAACGEHPYLVTWMAADLDGRPAYLVVPLLPRSLAALVRETGLPDPDLVASNLAQIAMGLQHLHKHGVVHGRLKPENVLIAPDGKASLSDWGMTDVLGEGRLDDAARACMAPAQLAGAPADVASDVYALGALGYLMLARRFPQRPAARLRRFLPQVDAPLAQLVEDCLEQRVRTPEAVLEALQRRSTQSHVTGEVAYFMRPHGRRLALGLMLLAAPALWVAGRLPLPAFVPALSGLLLGTLWGRLMRSPGGALLACALLIPLWHAPRQTAGTRAHQVRVDTPERRQAEALVAQGRQQSEQAEALYQRASEVDSTYGGAWAALGDLHYWEKHEVKAALGEYNRALELEPDNAEAFHSRGCLRLNDLQDVSGAIGDFDAAIDLKARPEYFLNRGLARSRSDDLRGALEDLNQACQTMADNAEAFALRGQVHMRMGNPDKALPDFDRALSLKPEAAYYKARGLCKQQLEDENGARADFNSAEGLKE